MDTQVLLDFRSNIRKVLLGTDPTITLETLHKDGKRELRALWIRNLTTKLILSIPGLIYFFFYMYILVRILNPLISSENGTKLLSDHVNLRYVAKRFLFAAIGMLIVFALFYPTIIDRENIMFDIKRLLFGDGKRMAKDYKDKIPDASGLLVKFPGIFTIQTSTELDEVMAKMREAIGYNVVRGEDHIDVMSLAYRKYYYP